MERMFPAKEVARSSYLTSQGKGKESTKREPFCAEDGFGMVCVKKAVVGIMSFCLSIAYLLGDQ